MKKYLMIAFVVAAAGSMSAMDITNYSSTGSNYVVKTTGIGATATSQVLHDPEMAEMLKSMRKSELACYAREKKEREEKVKAEAAQNETSFGTGFKKGFFDKKSDSKK